MVGIYRSIKVYSPRKKTKILIVFDDIITQLFISVQN